MRACDTKSYCLKRDATRTMSVSSSSEETMLRWARPLIVVLTVLALLAGGTSGAWAGKAAHECDGMTASMVMEDCMRGGGDGGAMPGCPPLTCVSAQIFLPPAGNFVSPIVIQFVSASLPRDDLDLDGLSGPPNLRPPIA